MTIKEAIESVKLGLRVAHKSEFTTISKLPLTDHFVIVSTYPESNQFRSCIGEVQIYDIVTLEREMKEIEDRNEDLNKDVWEYAADVDILQTIIGQYDSKRKELEKNYMRDHKIFIDMPVCFKIEYEEGVGFKASKFRAIEFDGDKPECFRVADESNNEYSIPVADILLPEVNGKLSEYMTKNEILTLLNLPSRSAAKQMLLDNL